MGGGGAGKRLRERVGVTQGPWPVAVYLCLLLILTLERSKCSQQGEGRSEESNHLLPHAGQKESSTELGRSFNFEMEVGLLYAADIGDSSSESEQEAIRTA